MGQIVTSCRQLRKLHPTGFLTNVFGILLILISSFNSTINAQCAMACKGKLNVSLAERCEAILAPTQILTGGLNCPDARYRVDILDYGMKPIPSNPVITEEYIGKTLIARVYDSTSKNSCWTSILIEEKNAPIILCRKDTVFCNDSAVHYPPVFYDYCDPNPTIRKTWESVVHYTCDSHLIKLVVRAWVAQDSRGNISLPCVDSLWVKRADIDSVEYPKNWTKANDCSIECNAIYPKDAEGHPHPSYTGSPMIDGIPIWPEYNAYCNLAVSYEDIIIYQDNCKTKILRLWRVVEWWCGTANVRAHQQFIEIVDTKGPTLHCPYDITVSTSTGYVCQSYLNLPPVVAIDSCQDSLTYEIYSDGILISRKNGGYVTLDVGDHDVEYRVFDRCLNSSSCRIVVTVEDHNPPVAVCDNGIVVTMSRSDSVHVYAEVFDDGSHDECHLDKFLVRRMDFGAPCLYRDSTFRPFVRFCCEDVGKTLMVIFRVVDQSGNTNDCMIEVDVQDKTPPTISCPHDYIINCSKHVDTVNLRKFGGPNYSDNCVVTMTERVDTVLNQCQLGYFQRNFIVQDNMRRRDSCYQRIHVVNPNPFTYHQIIWPRDTTIFACGRDVSPSTLPAGYNYPEFIDVECSLPAHSFTDEVFNYIEDSSLCFKVLRRWKVIDWCQFYKDTSGNTQFMTWEHLQLLKVSNKNPPKLEDACDSIKICLNGNDCSKTLVRIMHRASDDCTPTDLLRSGFKLDLNNNGLIDSIYHTSGGIISWEGELPLGVHRFIWVFEDQCGNEEVCSQIVSITNCKLPTAYCLTGIVVNLTSQDIDGDGRPEGVIDVWANDLDHGSYQFCGNPVTLSFSRDSSDKYRRYTCDSLGQRRVEVWVTDRITGLQDRCITTVTVQDNNRYCRGGNLTSGKVAGLISTPDRRPIPSTIVSLQNNSNMIDKITSNNFAFENLTLGENYSVHIQNDQDYLEGISTFDIVKMQKHILGKETFSNVWQYLAADVTSDEKVTSADISALRKLILGIDTKFKNSMSWKYLISTYQFPDLENPWKENIPSSYYYAGIPGDMNYTDFYGVKVGDVSQSVWSNLGPSLQTRTGKKVELYAVNTTNNLVEIYSNDDMEIDGLQLTLQFDKDINQVRRILPAQVKIENSNVAYQYSVNGVLLMSWNSNDKVNVLKSRPLFVIEFEQGINSSLLSSIQINSDIISAEAYSSTEEIIDISWRSIDSNFGSTELSIGAPVPNPFYDYTSILVDALKQAEIQYSITDLNGNVIKNYTSQIAPGKNVLKIKGSEMPNSGIYMLKIEAAGLTKSMKLVKLNH